ncbi:hypothetical protein QO034_17795 [Sedimentitalea sp. JM2-8]|uniref:AAA+ family ATPase n=1 Tax=Sedimentitalea xiamensis TaxID=3050037 RepID=A0ABT7FIK1_9RHOB|nr:hypothetical protein [Sedimentitalea xiamensis]MDK3074946.1 hypothetical protein [Sedimentitalea xiamensis]
MKKRFALALAAALSASSASAQAADDGSGLMEKGLELFLDGLRQEMSPALENMRKLAEEYGPAIASFLEQMGPAFGEMLEDVKDWSAYEPPEILPNGDIILRRKQMPDSETPPVEPPPPGQTDI